MKNYYVILGIDRNTSAKNIKKRTYELGKKSHPKKSTSDVFDAKDFIDIIEAYTVLYNENTRETYHWILDHNSGKNLLRKEALALHRKIIKIESFRGIGHGKEYINQPFWIFRDDMKSTFWWNFASGIPI